MFLEPSMAFYVYGFYPGPLLLKAPQPSKQRSQKVLEILKSVKKQGLIYLSTLDTLFGQVSSFVKDSTTSVYGLGGH